MKTKKTYAWQEERQYRSWKPCIDVEVFRERVKALADPDNWSDRQFEFDFFSQFYGRRALSDEEYEALVQRFVAIYELPF